MVVVICRETTTSIVCIFSELITIIWAWNIQFMEKPRI